MATSQLQPAAAPASAVVRTQPPDLRSLLESLGELGRIFGDFLRWRADRLPSETILSLRDISAVEWHQSRAAAVAALRAALGEAGAQLSVTLSTLPCWQTAFRCCWQSRYEGVELVIQFSRPPFSETELAGFERALGRCRDLPEPLAAGRLAAPFRQWLALGQSAPAERLLLDVLQKFPSSAATEFPKAVPELCTSEILCYHWVDGTPVPQATAAGDSAARQKLGESLLEQICHFSIVDAELNPGAYVVTPKGSVGVRFLPRFAVVPAVHPRNVLKYLSAVFAGNAPAAAHALVRLSGLAAGYDARMLGALSGVVPDLKVNLLYPASAATVENHWRALVRLQPNPPLFVETMHRCLVFLGYQGARTGSVTAGLEDNLEQAYWPVLGRILRARLGDLLSRESASDWLIGSGLLLFEGIRQVNRFAEDLRDDDLSLRVEVSAAEPKQGQPDRTIAFAILGSILLAVLLVCLRWGAAASGPALVAAAAAAIAAALALYWIVARLE